jgi:arylsulfatase A
MNNILIYGSISILAVVGQSCKNSATTEAVSTKPYKPNVLLILTDDQGWGDISSHGNDTLATPNLDKLASESYRFDRFYVSPVCVPTRASLLTGRYHLRTGVHGVTGRKEVMRSTELTLPELFRSKDYTTFMYGKWHNGAQFPHNPRGQGFEHFMGFCAGHWNNYFDTELEFNGEKVETQGYITDVLTDSAIVKIQEYRRTPFFMYVAYNTPHTPYQVPDSYFDKYKNMGLPDDLACVYGMVENIDYNVGRLLQTLDETGLDERTLVIFLTDNGPNGWRFNGNMKGKKAWVDEGGVRVPFFLKIPWLNKNEIHFPHIAAHIDVLPTLASLCELEIPEGLKLDGINLYPYLQNENMDYPERFIYTDRGLDSKTPYGLRSQEYLLTIKDDTALFNLGEDPWQKMDISEDKPEIVKEYIQKYDTWYREVTAFGLNPPPIEIGHLAAPRVDLPAHEATFEGGVHFKEGNGWANDWLVNVLKAKDKVIWKIRVVREGYYNTFVELDSPETNIGRELQLNWDLLKSVHKLNQAYISRNINSPDRVKRKEVYEKEWPVLLFDKIYLEKGTYEFVLAPGKNGLVDPVEIKSVSFVKASE